VPSLFDLTLVRNKYAAFGIVAPTWLLVAAAAIAIVAITVTVARAAEPIPPILGTALALPLGGALGNLIDRVRFGLVTDFLDAHAGPHEFPVFNVADSCVCIGVGLLMIYYWSKPTAASPTRSADRAVADKEII
jgi:signal peptidase II